MGIQAPPNIIVRLLGPCCLRVGDNLVPGVPAIFFRIAAYLTLSSPEHVQGRSQLSSLYWPNADDGKAAANLRQSVARIRHVQETYGFTLIEANISTLYLAPGANVYCDLIELTRHIDGHATLSPLQLAKVYGGDLLANQDPDGDEFDWLSAKRNELLLHVVDGIAEGIAPGSPYSQAERSVCARRLLELDPYREDAVCVLMEDAAERRHYARVSELYASLRTVLASDLGVQPSPETRALYASLMETAR